MERRQERFELTPDLDTLVERAVNKLNAHETSENGEPFASFAAADAVIKESGVSPHELAGRLIKQVGLTPKEIDIYDLDTVDTWDELFENISMFIIEHEIGRRFPEVSEAASDRLIEWDEREHPSIQ